MPECYITYSWEKDAKKAETLNLLLTYIKDSIENLSNRNINVIYDKESFEAGDNFREREKQLKESDCILLFFTPSYKQKVEAREDKGVYREYEILKERSLSELNGVIPILLSGTRENAVTDEFKDIICWDISKTNLNVFKSRGQIELNDALKSDIDKIVRNAIKEANAVHYCKDLVYESIEEEYKSLFLDSDKTPLPSECIIRTAAHDKIISQSTCVVIGRKGSGKSTLLDSIQKYNPQFFYSSYKKLLSLNIDDIDINFVYESLVVGMKKEFNFIPMTEILDTFWELVFVLQGMVTIGHEIADCRIDIDDKRYNTFAEITGKLYKLLGLPKGIIHSDIGNKGVCHCAAELLSDHLKNKILAHASDDTPLTAAFCSVNAYSILCKTFGKKRFNRYCASVEQCKKKIFFALDGFDTHSDDFRSTTDRIVDSNYEEYLQRKDFEIKLFRELILSVSKIKKDIKQIDMRKLFAVVNFCVILPQERYDEIAADDRDIAKRNFCTLNWDAYDLLEMLVKRLEYHYKIEAHNNVGLNERFYNIIQNKMPNIPTEINVIIDGFERKFPLYNYLLRLSFWRPRDLIRNFAIIMNLSKDKEDIREYAENIIKKSLISSAKRIIQDEFIHEYQSVYLNLKEILFRFKGTDFIQDYDSFCEQLSKIPVRVAMKQEYINTDSKLMLLYRLGVIGLYFSKEYSEGKYDYHIVYSFNEGMDPMEEFLFYDRRNARAKIIFNPIFAKYLTLNYNTKELICDFSWKYIITNHKLKDCIRRV